MRNMISGNTGSFRGSSAPVSLGRRGCYPPELHQRRPLASRRRHRAALGEVGTIRQPAPPAGPPAARDRAADNPGPQRRRDSHSTASTSWCCIRASARPGRCAASRARPHAGLMPMDGARGPAGPVTGRPGSYALIRLWPPGAEIQAMNCPPKVLQSHSRPADGRCRRRVHRVGGQWGRRRAR
jgi:hypothetical protein